MDTDSLSVLILAAGKGTRMKSDRAKVLHEVFFAPMVHHVLDVVSSMKAKKIVVVVGHQQEEVENALSGYSVSFAVQDQQLGTGHAVAVARDLLASQGGTVLILCGDTPLIRTQTLKDMLTSHRDNSAVLSVMTTKLDDPWGYGRILKDEDGVLNGIVEEKDATEEQRKIHEINAGVYAVEVDFLFDALNKVGTNNAQGELYLTDIVGLASRDNHLVKAFVCEDSEEVLGVNSRVELALAHARLQERRNVELMSSGVTMIRPESIQIQNDIEIGRDTVIEMDVQIAGSSFIGQGCRIGPYCHITNCRVENGAQIGPFCVLQDSVVAAGEKIIPFTVQS